MTAAVWLILIVGVLALLQGRYFVKVGFKRLSYVRKLSKSEVFEGDHIDLIEIISNDKLTPIPWLRVESKMSQWLHFRSQENLEVLDDQFHRSVFYLRPYSKITRHYDVTCIHRGYYDLSITTLTVGDLFGSDTASTEVHSDAKLFVYPTILGDDELPEDALRWQGDVSVHRWIFPDPILINGIREYQHGDSRKDIHWRATARTGALQVKNHDYTVFPRLLIVLNIEPEDNFWGQLSSQQMEEMEYGIRVCATLCNWAINNNMEVGFYSNAALTDLGDQSDRSIHIAPACSPAHLTHLLEAQAQLGFHENESIYRTIEILVEEDTTDCDVLVYSAFWNEALEKRCDQLRQKGNNIFHMELRKETIRYEDIASASAV